MSSRLALASVACAFIGAAAGCSSAPPQEDVASSSSSAITTTDVLSRAEQWVAVKLQYCQSANGARDYDTACSTYCNRLSNPAWDPYRSDCSGFVSWAWGLPAPGHVTSTFAPFVTDISKVIQAKDLRVGDAVNNDHHIMLFKAWTVAGKTATFLEEPGCSSSTPYAHELTSDVTLNGSSITVAWSGDTFTAIRYDAITVPDQPPVGSLDEASCANLAGWAEDPDSPGSPVTVELTFDGEKPGSGSLHVTASDHRNDLCTAIGSCDHGFALPMPAGMNDGKPHTVSANAVDLQTAATTVVGTKTFTCAPPGSPPPAGPPQGADGGTVSDTPSADNGGGGGCSVAANAPGNPATLLLSLLAVLSLRRRRARHFQ